MDLKEMNHLTNTAEIKLHARSKRNNSNAKETYEILFSEDERLTETNLDCNHSTKEGGKPVFGEVATLDWIKTWRAFEIN